MTPVRERTHAPAEGFWGGRGRGWGEGRVYYLTGSLCAFLCVRLLYEFVLVKCYNWHHYECQFIVVITNSIAVISATIFVIILLSYLLSVRIR